MQKFVQIIG